MMRLGQRLVLQFYGRMAWAYDWAVLALSGGLWYRWAFLAEHYVCAEPVLEVGCGTGRLLEHLAAKGTRVVGVDLSPQMVALAQRRLARRGWSGRVLRADASALPFADGSIGTIVTTFPANYVLQEATWREFSRVLRPGGRWVIVSGAKMDGFCPRLAGLYLLRVLEGGWKAASRVLRGRAGIGVQVPSCLFARQAVEWKTADSVPIKIVLLGKD